MILDAPPPRRGGFETIPTGPLEVELKVDRSIRRPIDHADRNPVSTLELDSLETCVDPVPVLIALAVVALSVSIWVNEGLLWRWTMTKKVRITRNPRRHVLPDSTYLVGWKTVKRWDGAWHGPYFIYDHGSGLRVEEGISKNGNSKMTRWSLRGNVYIQKWNVDEYGGSIPEEVKTSPPWLWGVFTL